jgi:hypothetical protein
MSTSDMSVPDELPILSRGKHRSPHRGACFMELASYLAGERWSDHPACTHPLLASVARAVNDYTSDEGRSRLAVLVPSVIGLTSDDLRVDAHIALRCARTALPIVAVDRQRVMAVSVLSAERILAKLEGRPTDQLQQASSRALKRVPRATRWALRFARDMHTSPSGFRRNGAPSIVASAITGIARAGRADTDDVLHDLLVDVIADCRALVGDHTEQATPDAAVWADLRRLTAPSTRD